MSTRFTTKRRDFLRLSAMGTAGAAMAACAPSATTSTAAGPKTDTSRLVIGISELGTQNWKPWLDSTGEQHIIRAIGETLVRSNPTTGALEPNLAESWSVSADGTVWTFKLRPNVPFHDGFGTMTAEDVKFSWEQFTQKDSTFGQAAVIMRQAVGGDMKNFEIVGPLEFRLRNTVTKPSGLSLPVVLSSSSKTVVIQSKKYWETQPTEAEKHPLGTGPFKFVSSTPGIEVQLQAVENHWRQTSAFKAVTVKIIADAAARLAQVQSGAVDFAALTPQLAAEAKKTGVNVLSVKDIGSMDMALGGQFPGDPKYAAQYDRVSPWIQADSPEKGLAIRQALSLAIDRRAILDKVLAGEGTLTHGPIIEYPSNPQLVDPAWKLPAYDVAQAKQLLAKGGYPNGFPINLWIFENRPGTGAMDVDEAVAGMWENIGIKVTRRPVDYAVFRPNFFDRTTSGMAYAYLTPYFEEALQAFQGVYLPGITVAVAYDPAITEGAARLSAEADQTKRFAITRGIISTLIDNMRQIPLFSANLAYGTSKKIAGWTPLRGQADLNNLETLVPR